MEDAILGLVIMNSLMMGFLFNWSVRMRTEFEGKMVSVERVYEYTFLEPEEDPLPPVSKPAGAQIYF